MQTQTNITRRHFLETASLAGAGVSLGLPHLVSAADQPAAASPNSQPLKPAALGGNKAHPGSWPKWPVFDQTEEKALQDTLQSGQWFRYYNGAVQVSEFEKAYANRAGAKRCVATCSGTSALSVALGALDIGPGDEVII